MGLIVFNKQNCSESLSRKPKLAKIRVSKELGIVYINSTALDLMGLKPGDFVEFLFDDSKPVSWYIRRADSETGLVIRKNSTSGKVHNQKIANYILETYLPGVDSPTFQLSGSPEIAEQGKNVSWCILNKLIQDGR